MKNKDLSNKILTKLKEFMKVKKKKNKNFILNISEIT